MIKIISSLIIFATTLSLPAFSSEIPTMLTLYTWEEYISDEVVASFKQKTGITIRQVYFDSDQTRDEIVASASGKQFDIVVFDSIAGLIFGKNNHLLAISASTVPNIAHIDKRWQETCGNFGVPYAYGTVGFVYDKTQYQEPPDSWLDLLQPSVPHRGHVVMVEDMTDTLIPPLIYLGYNINSEDRGELREAYELLLKQVPFVLNYTYALTNAKSADKASRMHIALAYSGDQHALNEVTGTENWKYVIPKEGTAVWMDCMSVTSWSEKQKEALIFLNYITDPQVAAINTEKIYTATPISGARQFMNGEAASGSELFPTEEIMQNAQMYRILSDDNLRQRGRILDTLLKRHETQ